jgi:hypothetical protein
MQSHAIVGERLNVFVQRHLTPQGATPWQLQKKQAVGRAVLSILGRCYPADSKDMAERVGLEPS